jgi:hypothetical protein
MRHSGYCLTRASNNCWETLVFTPHIGTQQTYPVHHQRATNVRCTQPNQHSRNTCQPIVANGHTWRYFGSLKKVSICFATILCVLTKTGTMAAFSLHIEAKRSEQHLKSSNSRPDLTPCRFQAEPRTVSTHSMHRTRSSAILRTLQANNCFQCCVQAPPMLEAITIKALNKIGALLPTKYSERGSYGMISSVKMHSDHWRPHREPATDETGG